MKVVRVWTTLARRPSRQSIHPRYQSVFSKSDRYRRHASSVIYPTANSQVADDEVDTPMESTSYQPFRVLRIEGGKRPARRLSKLVDEDVIVSSSLSETLQAHKNANASGPVIRRVNRSSSPIRTNSKLKSTVRSSSSIGLELNRNTNHAGSARGLRDYEGRVCPLDMAWEIIGQVPRSLRLPWMRTLDLDGSFQEIAQDRLSAEIQAADAFFTPGKEEVQSAFDAWKELESYLQGYRPDLKLDLIGSRVSGLAMPLSDLDFNIKITSGHDKILESIWSKMKYEKEPRKVVETSYSALFARVPILVGIHMKTGLEIQVQHADTGYGSLETVKGLLAEHPNLRPLFKVLRQMTKIRGLNLGGGRITSYPLLNMIAVVLKLNPQECAPRHLGLNLLKFLDFWTDGIDLYNTGITHIPSPYVQSQLGPFDTTQEYFADEKTALDTISMVVHDPVGARPAFFNKRSDLHELHKGHDDYMLVLHDPANPYNDLGGNLFKIKHLQATLIDIKQRLKQDMAQWDRISRSGGQHKAPSASLLKHFLEGDYTLYNLERKRLVPRLFVD